MMSTGATVLGGPPAGSPQAAAFQQGEIERVRSGRIDEFNPPRVGNHAINGLEPSSELWTAWEVPPGHRARADFDPPTAARPKHTPGHCRQGRRNVISRLPALSPDMASLLRLRGFRHRLPQGEADSCVIRPGQSARIHRLGWILEQ